MRSWPYVGIMAGTTERLVDHEEAGPYSSAAAEAPAIALPLRLHADAVEELLERLPPVAAPPRLDARHVRAADPGALLTLGVLAGYLGVEAPALPVPPDALVPPLLVPDAAGAATLREAVESAPFLDRLAALGWGRADAGRLAWVVAELARNAVEHSGAPGWAAAWRTAPGELRIAVADAGVGFAGSLGLPDEPDALLGALVRGTGRPGGGEGRGTGLRRVGELVAGWGGRLRVRSRTVLLSGAPPWRDAAVRVQLPFLPGVQVEVVVPCR
jgi:anti-sigma regulatory factor (Ser/Thr protein kinase)